MPHYRQQPRPDKYTQRLPFFFRHLPEDLIPSLALPPHAAYSVSSFDDAFQNAYSLSKIFPKTTQIIDMTACSGVDSAAFSLMFDNITSYEIDNQAFISLQNHFNLLKTLMYPINNYEHKNESGIIELTISRTNALYVIDPPWGGPEYQKQASIRLKYGDSYLDETVNTLVSQKNSVFLKLPKNADLTHFDSNFVQIKVKNQLFLLLATLPLTTQFLQIQTTFDLDTAAAQIQKNIGNRPGLTQAFTNNFLPAQSKLLSQKLSKFRQFNDYGFFHSRRTNFGVVTGFVIPEQQKAETDGPAGALRLAVSLALNFNAKITIFTEEICAESIKKQVEFISQKLPFLAQFDVITPSLPGFERVYKAQSALFFVEKVGPAASGKPVSMRGIDCSEYCSEKFSEFSALSVGVGDGGNEIGCGCVNEAINCVVKTDFTVLADVSNFGAVYVGRAVNQRAFYLFCMGLVKEEDLVRIGVEGGQIDGVSGNSEVSVDGIDFKGYLEVIERLLE